MHALAPHLMRWRGVWPAYREHRFPDAVTDSNERRRIAARRRMRTLRRVRREAIRRGASPALVMVTLDLPGELYGLEAHREAREVVRELVGGWPAWFTLESGRHTGLHAHIVTTVEAVPGLLDVPGLHGVPVWHLRGLLAYLSKPRDAHAARSNEQRHLSLPDVIGAAERYLTARAAALVEGRERLPAGSGTLNVPQRRQPFRSPLLLLACLLEVVRLEVERGAQVEDHRAAVLDEKRHQSRRRIPTGTRRHAPRRCRLPGLPERRTAYVCRYRTAASPRAPPRRRPRPWSWTPRRRGSPMDF